MTGHDDNARCREIFARLSEYLDGELDVEHRTEIAAHMEGCTPCEAFLRSLRRTITLLERAPGRRMPAELRKACLDLRDSLRDRS